MRKFPILILLMNSHLMLAQTPITSIITSNSPAPSSYSYTNAGINYFWGQAPNNTRVFLDGFSAGGTNYSYAAAINGDVRLRRVNNANVSGNFTLVWAEYVLSGTDYHMFPSYQNDSELFLDAREFNKGTDNFFDNISSNGNNVERLDWIIPAGFSTSAVSVSGFAVFERGAAGSHDPFCISAITALDGMGNPSAYGNILRITSANYADAGPLVTYRILKSLYPADLLESGTNTQSRGGVYITLQDLGIASGQTIYGYSLFANDLPVSATPTDLVDYTNPTNFPTNTGTAPGGIDLVSVTGMFIANSVLPVTFMDFTALEENRMVSLNWQVENERAVTSYEVERSFDGRQFAPIARISARNLPGGRDNYHYRDNITGINSSIAYYRIRQRDHDGSFSYSKIVSIRLNGKQFLTYPNPVRTELFINVLNDRTETIQITLHNTAGQLLLIKPVVLRAGNNSFTLQNLDNLSAGVLLVRLQWPDGRKREKLVSRLK